MDKTIYLQHVSRHGDIRHDTQFMWEASGACEMHFTYLISGLALRCQYGWSRWFFHITVTTSWALPSRVLISGKPRFTPWSILAVCPAQGATTVRTIFLIPRKIYTTHFARDRSQRWLFLIRRKGTQCVQNKHAHPVSVTGTEQSEKKLNKSEPDSLAEQKYAVTQQVENAEKQQSCRTA